MATKRQASKRTARNTRKVRVLDAVVRVSQRNGREGDSFHSPIVQEEACRQWAAFNGAKIGRVFDETDSVSGGTIEGRVVLGEAMQRALTGKSDGIIVMAVDRFGRNLVEGVDAIKQLKSAGASFVAVGQGIDTGNTDKQAASMSDFVLGLMFLLAERERAALIEKWEDTRHRHIVELGIPNHAPFGYRKDEKTRKLVKVPAEARIVVEVFERRAAGDSWARIVSDFEKRGVHSASGGKWQVSTLRDLLNRRTYLGEVASGHDYVNPNAHKAIVTQAQWDAAHARDLKRGNRLHAANNSDVFLLLGVARCASCGGSMVQTFGTGNRVPRYVCRRRYSWGKCAAPASISQPALDALAVKALHADGLSELGADVVANDALDDARDALRRASANLERWVTDPMNDVMRTETPEAYEAGQNARVSAVTEARARVAREEATAGVRATLPTNLAETWGDITNDERRTWLSAYFTVIAVHPGGRHGGADVPEKRVDCFTVDDADTPTGFMGKRDGRRVTVRRPILKR